MEEFEIDRHISDSSSSKEQEWMQECDKGFDPDSSRTVFSKYQNFPLNADLRAIFDIRDYKAAKVGICQGIRYCYYERKNVKDIPDGFSPFRSSWCDTIALRGDTLFNTKNTPFNVAFDQITKLTYLSPNEQNALVAGHHCMENFGMIFRTGGLQQFKCRSGRNDRPDVFLWNLKHLFIYLREKEKLVKSLSEAMTAENDEEIMKIGNILAEESPNGIIPKNQNGPALILLCSLFENEYDYAKAMWNIENKQLIDEMLELGQMPLDNEKVAREYVNIAFRFWKSRSDVSTLFPQEAKLS